MKPKTWALIFLAVVTTLLVPYEINTAKVPQTYSITMAAVPEDNQLLSIAFVGGRCVYGLCRAEIVIDRDGSYTFKDGSNYKRAGILDQVDTADLTDKINRADFNRIKSKQFQGICPSASDRSEKIYTFYTQGRVEAISACQVAIDPKSSLFSRVSKIIDEIKNF